VDRGPDRAVWFLLSGNHMTALLLLMILGCALPALARDKNKMVYGEGLLVEIPQPISEVEPVVEEIAGDGIIHGSKEYEKDEFIAGAKPAESSSLFSQWKEGGKVFYKVREKALDPRNFHNSRDEGTLAVRYVVKAEGEKKTILRIDALFQEDVRRTIHKSNGSVESEEYKDIRDHLDAVLLMKKEDSEAKARRQEMLDKKKQSSANGDLPFLIADSSSRESASAADSGSKTAADPTSSDSPAHTPSAQNPIAAPPAVQPAPVQPAPVQPAPEQLVARQPTQVQSAPMAESAPGQTSASLAATPVASLTSAVSGQTLEERVKGLRKEVERLVKSPGAALRSAPFHTASALATLSTGTEVLILVSTPYWYGVETHEGQHGWMMRDELEDLP
jgi:hypothetical protein